MLGGSAMRKNLFPFLIIGVVSLILPQYALCLSDDSSINVQYANYILEVGTFDINKLLNGFFGENAKQLTEVSVNTESDYIDRVIYRSDDSTYECEFSSQNGYFLLSKPSRIPTHYRTSGEGIFLPPPSSQQGKYTVQDADWIARDTLNNLLGIHNESIELIEAIHENPDKERSRAYRLFYSYVIDGLDVIPISEMEYSPYIEVRITDDGIVYASGVCLIICNPVSDNVKFLSIDDLIKKNPWASSFGRTELSYYLQKTDSGELLTKLVWYTFESDSWFSGNVYDATTGKEIGLE